MDSLHYDKLVLRVLGGKFSIESLGEGKFSEESLEDGMFSVESLSWRG